MNDNDPVITLSNPHKSTYSVDPETYHPESSSNY
jgi:hypothetical protein